MNEIVTEFRVAVALRPVGAAGPVVSTTIASTPAMLFAPVGTAVEVIALPAVSSTAPAEYVYDETSRSAEFWPDAIVYVPVMVRPASEAVRDTVAPVLSVTVIVLPARIDSFTVAVMLIDCPVV